VSQYEDGQLYWVKRLPEHAWTAGYCIYGAMWHLASEAGNIFSTSELAVIGPRIEPPGAVREIIVRWLRAEAGQLHAEDGGWVYDLIADRIERGEHLKPAEPAQ
jgi:hypothetical protein